jgi:hypothetical protein
LLRELLQRCALELLEELFGQRVAHVASLLETDLLAGATDTNACASRAMSGKTPVRNRRDSAGAPVHRQAVAIPCLDCFFP